MVSPVTRKQELRNWLNSFSVLDLVTVFVLECVCILVWRAFQEGGWYGF